MNWELTKLLEMVNGSVACVIDGEKNVYASGQEAKEQLDGKYVVVSIGAEGYTVVLSLKKDTTVSNDMNADWVKEHVATYGKEPNPFDGM